jgi:hypothetical protein
VIRALFAMGACAVSLVMCLVWISAALGAAAWLASLLKGL